MYFNSIYIPAMASILYIDDDQNACVLARTYLKKYKHDVIIASDTQAAREILAAQSVDLIICDIGLPGESGIDFHRWLQTQEQYKRISFLFTSAHAMGFDEDLVQHKDIFVAKPIFFPALAEKISEILKTS